MKRKPCTSGSTESSSSTPKFSKSSLGDILDGAQGLKQSIQRLHSTGDVFYAKEFLEPRPLLRAMEED